jgi:hypothetical protein
VVEGGKIDRDEMPENYKKRLLGLPENYRKE